MSGGSFDYLCYKDVSDILARPDLLDRMALTLETFGPSHAATVTRVLIQALSILGERCEHLRDVWREVEWCTSGDVGRADVEEVLQTFDKAYKLSEWHLTI